MLNPFYNRHKPLADRLRREAGNARPAFSAGLHHRTMRAVRADARIERPAVRRWPHWNWALASAAVALISVSAAFWGLAQADRPANSPEIAARPIEPAPIEPALIEPAPIEPVVLPAQPTSEEHFADAGANDGFDAVSELFKVAADHVETIQEAEKSVESELVGEQLAMLDHDARIFAGWLIEPIAATLEN